MHTGRMPREGEGMYQGMMHLQAKESQRQPRGESTRSWERGWDRLHHSPHKEPRQLTPCFQTAVLQNTDTIYFCSSHPTKSPHPHIYTPYVYTSPYMPSLCWGPRTPNHPTPVYTHHMYTPAHTCPPCAGGQEPQITPPPHKYTICIHQPIHALPVLGAKNPKSPHPHIYTPYVYTSPYMPSPCWGPRTPNHPCPSPHLSQLLLILIPV